jgi:hypothetical protein
MPMPLQAQRPVAPVLQLTVEPMAAAGPKAPMCGAGAETGTPESSARWACVHECVCVSHARACMQTCTCVLACVHVCTYIMCANAHTCACFL